MEDNNLIIYKNSDGNIIVDAIYKDETLWLSQKGMSKVFEVGVPAISKHLENIFEETELIKNSVVSKKEITVKFGLYYENEEKKYYNKILNDIISLEVYNIFKQKCGDNRLEDKYNGWSVIWYIWWLSLFN